MATHVKNSGRVPKQVGIILADGTKASIRVMHRTRKAVELPEGVRVDGNWMALEGDGIIVFEDKVVPPSAPVANVPAEVQAQPEAEAATAEPVAAEADAPAETKTENTQ